MPTYRYELQQESGDLLVGSIAAQTASVAASAIQRRGGRIIRLVPLQSEEGNTLKKICIRYLKLRCQCDCFCS